MKDKKNRQRLVTTVVSIFFCTFGLLLTARLASCQAGPVVAMAPAAGGTAGAASAPPQENSAPR